MFIFGAGLMLMEDRNKKGEIVFPKAEFKKNVT